MYNQRFERLSHEMDWAFVDIKMNRSRPAQGPWQVSKCAPPIKKLFSYFLRLMLNKVGLRSLMARIVKI
jgi:hypothetical protein